MHNARILSTPTVFQINFGGSTSISSVTRQIQNFNNHHHHPHSQGSTSLYSSQESLNKNTMVVPAITHSLATNIIPGAGGGVVVNSSNSVSNRPSAGAPQFQTLSETIRSGSPPQTGSNHRLRTVIKRPGKRPGKRTCRL